MLFDNADKKTQGLTTQVDKLTKNANALLKCVSKLEKQQPHVTLPGDVNTLAKKEIEDMMADMKAELVPNTSFVALRDNMEESRVQDQRKLDQGLHQTRYA